MNTRESKSQKTLQKSLLSSGPPIKTSSTEYSPIWNSGLKDAAEFKTTFSCMSFQVIIKLFSLLLIFLPVLRVISRLQNLDFLPIGHVLHQTERQVHWPRHQVNVDQRYDPSKSRVKQTFQTLIHPYLGPRYRMGPRLSMWKKVPWIQKQVLEILQ